MHYELQENILILWTYMDSHPALVTNALLGLTFSCIDIIERTDTGDRGYLSQRYYNDLFYTMVHYNDPPTVIDQLLVNYRSLDTNTSTPGVLYGYKKDAVVYWYSARKLKDRRLIGIQLWVVQL